MKNLHGIDKNVSIKQIFNENDKLNFSGIGYEVSRSYNQPTRNYIGEYKNGKEHGIGTYKSRGGSHCFAGMFENGVVQGIGVKEYKEKGRYSNNELYCGQYVDNQRIGIGYWQMQYGSVYIGEFNNHNPKGIGIMLFDDMKFIGLIENWQAKDGHWYDKDNNKIDITEFGYEFSGLRYEGTFDENGFRHGKGALKKPNGERYIGEWVHGKKKGKGVYYHFDGETYIGDFNDPDENTQEINADRYPTFCNGKGTLISTDGSTYVGDFKDGMFHGQGMLIVECENHNYEINQFRSSTNSVYEGGWKEGKKHGFGKHVLSNGAFYEGEYFEDQMLGEFSEFNHRNQNYERNE